MHPLLQAIRRLLAPAPTPPIDTVTLGPGAARRLRRATAPHILLLEPGATLAPGALARLTAECAAHPETDLIYADEDRLAPDGTHIPYRKPAWSIDLALEQDLVGPICLLRRALLAGLKPETPLPHDLALRANPRTIRHIPEILAHRLNPSPPCPGTAAIHHALAALPPALSTPTLVPSPYTNAPRIQWRLPNPAPRVSVILPTRDQPDLLARCTYGLLHRTAYPDIELLVADNGTTDPEAQACLARLATDPRVRILPVPGPFNYAAINNHAAAQATGEILLLLNNDVEVLHPTWLAEMVGHAIRPGIGAVGARLLFADGRIQHAGIVGGVGTFDGGPGVAGHFGLAATPPDPGHGGQFIHTREVLAVTAACLALRRDLFLAVGGLDATHLPIALNDLDLCLRLRAAGHRTLFTPFAELRHHESASRGPDTVPGAAERFHRECRTVRDRWGPVLDADPFYNPAFSRFDHSFQPAPLGTASRIR